MDLGSAGGSAGNWMDEEELSLAGWNLLRIAFHSPESGKSAKRRSRGCQVTRSQDHNGHFTSFASKNKGQLRFKR